ncbi:GPI mannosyltransferase 4-like [Anneissia japonica]|uniref:GPI mannosyltransferase 4-like n=1 Tax=Anneissia japonica TaxID=1529436 RepID=UPI0014259B55|nr:GPI mannosyltransferase 4-like [Anneissia japonica]
MGDYRTWCALVAIRILWCILLQTGYIHPDEFFQNTEPMAGDAFGYKVRKPWEFNSTFPCRSVVLPYITSGIVFKMLNLLNEQGLITITSAMLVVLPRLIMTLMSLIMDYSIYKMCNILNFSATTCLTIFASSFVTLVFYTRTMSNSLEAILFSVLLALVIDTRKTYFVGHEKSDLNEEGEGDKEDENTQQKRDEIIPDDSNKCFYISVILIAGFFNRPTFVIFAVVPMLFWLAVDATNKSCNLLSNMLTNGVKLLPGVVLSIIIFVVADSRYYGTLDTSSICCIHSFVDFLSSNFIQNLTVTPLNFLQYNLDSSNLEEHGLHPHITHILVNSPLLFLPLLVCFASEITAFILGVDSGWGQTSIAPIRGFFQLSFFTPLLLLSFFPHQEPRFLIPLLVPLVLLYSKLVMSPDTFEPNMPWIVWNLLACLIFGVLHQGGLIPCLGHLNNIVSKPVANNQPVHYHIMFYHTYMPPEHLLAWREPKFDDTNNFEAEKLSNILSVYDLAGADRMTMHNIVEKLFEEVEIYKPYEKEVYIASPSSLDHQFCRKHIKFNFELQKQFTPHISTEDLPELFPTYNCVHDPKRSYVNLTSIGKVQARFSLNLYRVVPGR